MTSKTICVSELVGYAGDTDDERETGTSEAFSIRGLDTGGGDGRILMTAYQLNTSVGQANIFGQIDTKIGVSDSYIRSYHSGIDINTMTMNIGSNTNRVYYLEGYFQYGNISVMRNASSIVMSNGGSARLSTSLESGGSANIYSTNEIKINAPNVKLNASWITLNSATSPLSINAHSIVANTNSNIWFNCYNSSYPSPAIGFRVASITACISATTCAAFNFSIVNSSSRGVGIGVNGAPYIQGYYGSSFSRYSFPASGIDTNLPDVRQTSDFVLIPTADILNNDLAIRLSVISMNATGTGGFNIGTRSGSVFVDTLFSTNIYSADGWIRRASGNITFTGYIQNNYNSTPTFIRVNQYFASNVYLMRTGPMNLTALVQHV